MFLCGSHKMNSNVAAILCCKSLSSIGACSLLHRKYQNIYHIQVIVLKSLVETCKPNPCELLICALQCSTGHWGTLLRILSAVNGMVTVLSSTFQAFICIHASCSITQSQCGGHWWRNQTASFFTRTLGLLSSYPQTEPFSPCADRKETLFFVFNVVLNHIKQYHSKLGDMLR